jgi:hypothetical protein
MRMPRTIKRRGGSKNEGWKIKVKINYKESPTYKTGGSVVKLVNEQIDLENRQRLHDEMVESNRAKIKGAIFSACVFSAELPRTAVPAASTTRNDGTNFPASLATSAAINLSTLSSIPRSGIICAAINRLRKSASISLMNCSKV